MFTHQINIKGEEQAAARKEAEELLETVSPNSDTKLKFGEHEVGEKLTELFLHIAHLLAEDCALEIDGLPQQLDWSVAKALISRVRPNVTRVDIIKWCKEGKLTKLEDPNPRRDIVSRDSVEKLIHELIEEKKKNLHALWDFEHEHGLDKVLDE
jgi:hypothetical protein